MELWTLMGAMKAWLGDHNMLKDSCDQFLPTAYRYTLTHKYKMCYLPAASLCSFSAAGQITQVSPVV